MLERVLLRAISGPVPDAPPAAAIFLSACAGRCRAGAWPSPGAGGGSDRLLRPGCDPQKSLVGPPRHVLPVLNGCVGTQARTPSKPRRSRPGTLPVYPLSPASMSASVGSTRISSPAARLVASPTTGLAAGRWAPGCGGTASSGRSSSPPGAPTAACIRPWPLSAAKPCWCGPTAPGASPKLWGSWPRPIASMPRCWRARAAWKA